MPLPSGLTYAQLREVQLDALLDRTLDRDAVQAMAETLLVLLDEAQVADEEHASIDDLHGVIERLEELRVEAVNADAQREEEADKRHVELRAQLDAEKRNVHDEAHEVSKTADEWRRRAELAEHEIAEQRSNVELALQRRATAEGDARRLSTVLLNIANGKPEEAYRTARFALGRDIVEKTGTLVVLDDGKFAHTLSAPPPALVVVPVEVPPVSRDEQAQSLGYQNAAGADAQHAHASAVAEPANVIPTRSQRRAQQSAPAKRKTR